MKEKVIKTVGEFLDKKIYGFAANETEDATYKIFYLTKKITCEMERE